MNDTIPMHDRPLAAKGLLSYRFRLPYGQLFTGSPAYVMIGARNDVDALGEARRSFDAATREGIERWDGKQYVSIREVRT